MPKMTAKEMEQNLYEEDVKESSKMLLKKGNVQINGAITEPVTLDMPKVGLQRELGLFSAVNMIVSVMIGSGIFISPGSVLAMSGSVGLCLIIWALCGLISYLGALGFGELGTLVSESGAEYAYYQASFPSVFSRFWGNLPGFIFIWIMVFVVRPAEVAILSLTFSEYVVIPINDFTQTLSHENQEWAVKGIAAVAIGIITCINFRSVKLYVLIQNIFSSLKIIACMIVIGGGIYYLAMGNTENISKGFEGTETSLKGLALAFYSGLWAFDGWSSVTIVTEEIKCPEKNIPRSISIGVPLVTCLYFMMNVAYMAVLPIHEITSHPAVAIRFAEKIIGNFSFIIPISVVLSTFGCALSVQFGVSRLCFVAARNGHMIKALSYIHVSRKTPAPAVLLQGLLSIVFVMSGEIIHLIGFVGFLIWIFYGMAMVSLLIMRKTKRDSPRPYKVPIVVPFLLILVSLFLAITPLVLNPDLMFLIAIGLILIAVIIYYPVIYKGKHPSFMGKVTKAIQYVFTVVPPDDESNRTNKESNNEQVKTDAEKKNENTEITPDVIGEMKIHENGNTVVT